jgi:Tol biopolymer transport system component
MAWRLRFAPIVLLAACGRIGFDAELPPAGPCDWIEGPSIQAPEPLWMINTGASESAPYLIADGSQLYFSSEAGGGTPDFYIADRDDWTLFVEPRRFERLTSDASDIGLTFAADHHEVVYASNREGGAFDIFRARRPTIAAAFVDQSVIGGVTTSADETAPHLAESDRALYFARGEVGARDLYVARRSTTDGDSFGSPERLAELSSDADETSPALTADGLVIVFASSRAGSMDLYYATRASTEEPFGEPIALEGINSEGEDTDPFITRDGCFLYFASDRDGGELDLFVARAFR